VLNSRRCDLLDHDAILGQLVALGRRTTRTGRDTIDHAPHAHDDIANVVAGVVHLVLKKARPEVLIGLGGKVFNRDGATVSDSVSPFFDKFKTPAAPTSNDEVFAAGLKAQHEQMKLRVEGPSRPPIELDNDAKARLEKFKQDFHAKRSGIGSLHGKLFRDGAYS
jgi:hypothetical protein